MSTRSREIKQLTKQIAKMKLMKSLPEIGQKVKVRTIYNTERICIYKYLKFKVIDKPYTLSRYEVLKWDGIVDG